MKRLGFLAIALWLFNGPVLASPVNVAQGAMVTLNGVYGVLRAGSPWSPNPVAAPGSLTDGVFLPAATDWNDGSVWWDVAAAGGVSALNSIIVDLGASYDIMGFIVQADDNDDYLIETWNGASWIGAWNIPAVGGYGLQTRPNVSDNTAIYVLAVPVTTDRLRFSAVYGDGYYSVSEIQAFADIPVPEPSSLALLGLGLALASLGARRNKS